MSAVSRGLRLGMVLVWLLTGCRQTPASGTPGTPTLAPLTATAPATASATIEVTASATQPEQVQAAGRTAPTQTLTPSATPDPLACLPPGPAQFGLVKWVSDARTIVIEMDGRLYNVRYLGIRTPANIPNIRFMGPPAERKNRELVENQVVALYADGPDQDEHGQLLRYVVTHGLFVNYELVRQGLAEIMSEAVKHATPIRLRCAETLQEAQTSAEQANLGLWSQVMVGAAQTEAAETPVAALVTTAVPPAATSFVNPTSSLAPSATLSAATTPSPSATLNATLTTATPTATINPTPPTATQEQPTNTNLTPGPTNTLPFITTFTPTSPGGPPDVYLTDLMIGAAGGDMTDEYIELTNDGPGQAVLTGWKLVMGKSDKSFTFSSFTLAEGDYCRVYTNLNDRPNQPRSCVDSSFNSSTSLWPDDQEDCISLYAPGDALGEPSDMWCTY